MVLLRFPFWFSPPPMRPNTPKNTHSRGQFFAAAVTVCAAAGAIAAVTTTSTTKEQETSKKRHPNLQDAFDFLMSKANNHALPMWASLSLADSNVSASASYVEPKTGAEFPKVVGETKQLLGVGLRRKSILGLKNIDVYAFGVYADNNDIKKLANEKLGNQSVAHGKGKDLNDDLLEADIQVTVRLKIVYSKLSIRSVRSAFEESVGSRLQKFGGSENKDLLQRFTSQFKDEYKIPKGSVIDISREKGSVLRTIINGEEIGSIQSKLLCRSIFDLYIGEDPFDRKAKEGIELKLASLAQD